MALGIIAQGHFCVRDFHPAVFVHEHSDDFLVVILKWG